MRLRELATENGGEVHDPTSVQVIHQTPPLYSTVPLLNLGGAVVCAVPLALKGYRLGELTGIAPSAKRTCPFSALVLPCARNWTCLFPA